MVVSAFSNMYFIVTIDLVFLKLYVQVHDRLQPGIPNVDNHLVRRKTVNDVEKIDLTSCFKLTIRTVWLSTMSLLLPSVSPWKFYVGPCGRLTVSNSTVGLRYAADLLTRSETYLAQKTQTWINLIHLCALPCCVRPLISISTIPNHKGV